MLKDKNLSYWSLADLRSYIDKPIDFDNQYNFIKNPYITYTEEELQAIESALAMERGTIKY